MKALIIMKNSKKLLKIKNKYKSGRDGRYTKNRG